MNIDAFPKQRVGGGNIMSKTILAEVEGFTPLMDTVVKDVGITAAAVFGRMWRYCQMSDGVCNASIDTIAEGLGDISRSTIIRHIETLIENGYIKDHSPDLRNHPHTYSDTGKAAMVVKIGVSKRNSKENPLSQNDTPVYQNDIPLSQNDTACCIKMTHEDSSLREDSREDLRDSGEKQKTSLPEGSGLDWLIAAGVKPDALQETLSREQRVRAVTDCFEAAMEYNPLPWSAPKLAALQRFLMDKSPEDIKTFARWSRDKYSGASPAQIRKNPELAIDLWKQAFIKKEDDFLERLKRA